VGDFNGDGKPDVALLSSAIQVLLGNGDGTLRAPIQSTLSQNSLPGYFAIAGDFNGDGKLDIAYTGYVGAYVGLAFGNGDGTFQSGVKFSTDASPLNVVQGDFNCDGRPDFVVSNLNTSTVNVFFGAQLSGLSISATHAGNFTAGQTGAYQITIRNLAFASASGAVTVTDSLPAGLTATAIGGNGWICTLISLTCTLYYPVSSGTSFPLTITIAVNVSGGLSPSIITNQASVSLGDVVNTATDPTTIVLPTTTTLAASPNPSSLGQEVTMTATVTAGAAGPVQFSDGGTPLGTVTLTDGQASFSTRLLPPGLHSLAAAYTGDAAHAPSNSTIQAQTVNASAANGLTAGTNYPTGAGPWGIAVADFNGDGKTDLVTANATANTISVLLGNGDGTFSANTDYAAGTAPFAVVAGDFDNGGKTDIAVASQTSNHVSILLGNGDGTFRPPFTYTTADLPSSLAVADLNNDGRASVVVANGSNGTLTSLFVSGDGTFHSATNVLSKNLPSVTGFAIGDFNHDGRADVACFYEDYIVEGLLAQGDGTFQPSFYYSTYYVYALTVGDLNADGKTDIATTDGNSMNILDLIQVLIAANNRASGPLRVRTALTRWISTRWTPAPRAAATACWTYATSSASCSA
jgi:uncharacterized repeat protein (TIGR01451 family)